MKRIVIDSSVLIKWLAPEDDSEAALRFVEPVWEGHAPDFLLTEVANVAWKKVRRGELDSNARAERFLEEASRTDLAFHPSEPLLAPALRIALATGRTVYDSLYLALADQLGTYLVTADRKLFTALQGGAYARLVAWFEDDPFPT